MAQQEFTALGLDALHLKLIRGSQDVLDVVFVDVQFATVEPLDDCFDGITVEIVQLDGIWKQKVQISN